MSPPAVEVLASGVVCFARLCRSHRGAPRELALSHYGLYDPQRSIPPVPCRVKASNSVTERNIERRR